jgi:thiol-disulfide isomerase/thioredoxin
MRSTGSRETIRRIFGFAGIAVLLAALPGAPWSVRGGDEPSRGQRLAKGQAFSSLADLEAAYERQAVELRRQKLADLAALAQRQPGVESERAYRSAFDLAVAQGLYQEAEAAARAYLAKEDGDPATHALAGSIVVVAHADRGQFDRSLAELKGFLDRRASAQTPDDRRLPAALVCAVGEAYLQRLVRSGRLDIARDVCRLAISIDHPDRTTQAYFTERLARLDMVGKPAPAIEGTDVDGKPVRLADLKGKVVLVDFWATWCPPCVADFNQIRELNLAYRERGFAVIGVNLDGLAEDPSGKRADAKDVLSSVRWFLLQHRASWPSMIGPAAEAAARAYAVNELPASFLVGRDGTVVQVELSGDSLNGAVTKALGN